MSRDGDSRLSKVGLVILSVLLTFVCAELGLRSLRWVVASQRVTLVPVAADGTANVPHSLYIRTPRGRRLAPNTTLQIRNHTLSGLDVEIRTNSFGFRGPELVSDERPKLMVVGDSITFADYLPEDEGFVARLGEELGMQALNAGVGGVDLASEVLLLEDTVDAVDPDVVLIAMFLNDCQPSRVIEPLAPPWSYSQLAGFVHRRLMWIRVAGFSLGRQDGSAWRTDAAALRAWAAADDGLEIAWTESCWDHLRVQFDVLQSLARASGFELVVAYFPLRQQVEAEIIANVPQQHFLATTAAAGVSIPRQSRGL